MRTKARRRILLTAGLAAGLALAGVAGSAAAGGMSGYTTTLGGADVERSTLTLHRYGRTHVCAVTGGTRLEGFGGERITLADLATGKLGRAAYFEAATGAQGCVLRVLRMVRELEG
jgi:hypothetical protein